VNHRDLMLSAVKMVKFNFMELPEALQDEIVDGLDSRSLSLNDAVRLLVSRGFKLSNASIGRYYAAVRRERRLSDASRNLERIIEGFANQPCEETLKSLTNLIVAMAAVGLADGKIGIKDIDLAGVLQAMRRSGAAAEPSQGGPGKVDSDRPKGLSDATVNEIRRKILGCKS